MNWLTKALMWIGIIVLVWLGLPFLLKSVFGIFGLAFTIIKIIINLVVLGVIVYGILFLWKRVQSDSN